MRPFIRFPAPMPLLLAFVVLLGQVVIAATHPEDAMVCFTTRGTSLVEHVPTKIATVFVTATKTVTSNVLPETALPESNLATTVSSVSPGTTRTVTTTKTVTVKSTSTKTIPTSSGFKPVRSTLPLAKAKSNVDRAPSVKRAPLKKVKYAQNVDCTVHATTITTKTITEKKALSGVGTADLDAVHAMTKTVTKTTTTTDVVAGPTIYAACLEDNMFDYPSPNYQFYYIDGAYKYDVDSSSFNTSYACCVACITTFNCAGGVFLPGSKDSLPICGFGALASRTPQNQTPLIADYLDDTPPPVPCPIFNGYCGEITSTHLDG